LDDDAGAELPGGIWIGKLFASSECEGEHEPRMPSEWEEERPSWPGIMIADDMASALIAKPRKKGGALSERARARSRRRLRRRLWPRSRA
jgi:hypothetical protein